MEKEFDSQIKNKPQKRKLNTKTTSPKKPKTESTILQNLRIPYKTLSTQNDYEKHFLQVCNFILNHCILSIHGFSYRIVELEVYFYTNETTNHRDPYVHRADIQHEFGKWYFHQSGRNRNSKYKGGNRQGLGISIGEEQKGCCGSILIRSIAELGKEMEIQKVIEGPSLVVDCVLEKNEVSSIEELVKQKLKNEICVEKSKDVLCLIVNDMLPVLKVIQSNRFGLTLKKKGEEMERSKYVCRLYRFLTQPKRMKKGKPHMIVSLYHLGKSEEEIIELLGTSKQIVKTYTNLYEKGKKHKNVKRFYGINLTAKQVCELFGALS